MVAVLKTADAQASVGSNPTPSATKFNFYLEVCFNPFQVRMEAGFQVTNYLHCLAGYEDFSIS